MNTATRMPRRRADDPEPTEPVEPITIRFPASLRARALAVAKEEDRNFHSLVLYAVRRYVTEREREAKPDAQD